MTKTDIIDLGIELCPPLACGKKHGSGAGTDDIQVKIAAIIEILVAEQAYLALPGQCRRAASDVIGMRGQITVANARVKLYTTGANWG